MATVTATSQGSTTTAATTHNITLPAGTASGHLLVIIIGLDNTASASSADPAIDGFTGWTQIFQTPGDVYTTEVVLSAWYRVSDGSDGTQFTTDTSQESSWICYQIDNHDSTSDPPVSGTAVEVVASTSWNPPSVTRSGTGNTLWIECLSYWDGSNSVDGISTGFGNQLDQESGTDTAAGNITGAEDESDTATRNPNNMTTAATGYGFVNTICIENGSETGSAGGGGGIAVRAHMMGQMMA